MQSGNQGVLERGSFKLLPARELLEKQESSSRISTGSPELDSLVGGIIKGSSYLFYGDQELLSALVHQLLVHCAAPRTNGGFSSKAVFFNIVDRRKARNALSPILLGQAAKKMNLEPFDVFDKVEVCIAYNEDRQRLACDEICQFLKASRDDYPLVVLHNATCFLPYSHDFTKSLQELNYVTGKLKEVCSRKRAFVATAGRIQGSRSSQVSWTMGGSFFQARDGCDSSSEQMEELYQDRTGDFGEASGSADPAVCLFSDR
jgi:hypothetical protein